MAKKIFMSYRREDRPGYVARLKDDLERAFGSGRVFRDVEDIAGGSKWREVLEQNLREAGVLLLVIGPRWEAIWEARDDTTTNYVAFELSRAQELGVPVIPVTLDGAVLSRSADLGEVEWLRENQFYDISDKQGRWSADVSGLVRLIERMPGMVRADQSEIGASKKPGFGWGGIVKWGGILLAAMVVFGMLMEPSIEEDPVNDAVWQERIDPVPHTITTTPSPPGGGSGSMAGAAPVYPDITGVWRSQADDTIYQVVQYEDGSFDIESPGYGSGTGQFLGNMPRKFEVFMGGLGRGEFSVSNTDQTISGWFIESGSSRQIFDTLVRVR